ncbi:hypothetical protein GCM10027612_82430 [Microbispora bryophytorum subsp. camponoti]
MALIVVTTSPRVAPGLLAPAAWQALSRGRVLTGTPDHPYLPYLDEAGVRVEVVTPDPGALARESRTGTVVWLAAQDGDEDFMRAVGHAAISLDEPPEIEVVPGSYDLPGARLLDLVQVMDRLRRECPWDRKQTHESLVPYLVEEAYEVLETIHEGAYGPPLREELGDLLLQVMFHARLAQERTDPEGTAGDGFDIDDVAAGIVEKLVRRHPHVFAEVEVSGADEVGDNWETIKAAERAAKGRPPRCSAACRWASRRSPWPPSSCAGPAGPARPPLSPATSPRPPAPACSRSYGRPRTRGSTPRPS